MRWMALACVLLAGTARADLLRAGDKCFAVTVSVTVGDEAQNARAEQFMADALAEADRVFARTGASAMMPDLSAAKLNDLVVLALERCRRRPADDARSVAVDVYMDVRRSQTETPRTADPSAADYGVESAPASGKEQTDAQRYGGYPNSRMFNNESRCSSVVQLFDTRGMGPDNPRMKAFLTYTRVSLMLLDTITSVGRKEEPAVVTIGLPTWKTLPALFPVYCRTNPDAKLLEVVGIVYRTARATHGLPNTEP